MNESLEGLLQLASDGNDAAVKELVRRFKPQAHDLARAILGDTGLADDAVQEAFISAFQRLGDLREPQAFPAWLRQIVRTCTHRILRKQKEVAIPEEALSEDCGPDEIAQKNEVRMRVHEALESLPPAGRETVELFYLDELSCSEIADRLSIPEGTVKRRLHDARQKLRDLLIEEI